MASKLDNVSRLVGSTLGREIQGGQLEKFWRASAVETRDGNGCEAILGLIAVATANLLCVESAGTCLAFLCLDAESAP